MTLYELWKRYEEGIHHEWKPFYNEEKSLQAYLGYATTHELLERFLDACLGSQEILFVVGGRIAPGALEQIVHVTTRVGDAGATVRCYLSESPKTAQNHWHGMDAQALSDAIRLLGFGGETMVDLGGESTGAQAAHFADWLASHPETGHTIIVSASIDHSARLLAAMADALSYRGLLQGRKLIPLVSGEWDDSGLFGRPMHELAFAPNDGSEALNVAGGQYTWRYVNALIAKQQGRYLGQTIFTPTEMVQLLEKSIIKQS